MDLRHDEVDDAVSSARPIDLASLNAVAALHDRVDRKYLVSADVAAGVVRRLIDEQNASVLTIESSTSFLYRSNYFDTDDRVLLRLAAGARRRRFKVRTRLYEVPQSCTLEVKLREGRGVTTKTRLLYEAADALRITDTGRLFVANAIDHLPALRDLTLAPSVATRYLRSTLLIGGTRPARVTVDRQVQWASLRGDGPTRWAPIVRNVIVESKSSGPPTAADHLLWIAGVRPQRVSKFALASVLDDPHLPSNRWHRLLRANEIRRASPGIGFVESCRPATSPSEGRLNHRDRTPLR